MDSRTGAKVAIKKLYRPFQSELFAKRAYRELRLLKHMRHENVSRARAPSSGPPQPPPRLLSLLASRSCPGRRGPCPPAPGRSACELGWRWGSGRRTPELWLGGSTW